MSGDGLRFGVLGPLAVVRDGEPISLAGARRRALLALLVLHARERMSNDRLADELWSGRPPPTARTALQMHIRAIRRELGPALPLRTVPGGYVLDIPPDASDVTEFERGVTAGAAALREGDAPGALRELSGALALWRGPALADLPDAPSARADIARLEELRVTALERRMDAELALGRHAEVAAELGRLVDEQPYRERLRAQLMLALYRSGRQADALAQYQRGRDALVDDLGLDPGEDLQRLQRAILEHDPSLDAGRLPAPPVAPAPAPAPARRERKTVTTLLAVLHAEADPEDADALLRAACAGATQRIESFGGAVHGYSARMLVAVFGAPSAHEDDPERAVRAALAVSDEAEVEVRIAITTSETVVGADLDGTGAAARLLPGTGAVVVDDRTREATRRAIRYRRGGGTWQALQARAGIHDASPSRTRLVGRRRELAVLHDALDRVRTSSSPALVTVVGEPGIGKTRLLLELADPAACLLSGRSLPYGEGISFWALGMMLKALAGIFETDSPEEAEAKLSRHVAAVVPDPAERDWVLRHAGGLVGTAGDAPLAGGERRGQEFAAWRRLLEAVAEEQPLVLAFEDLHWADDGLLDFVDHLVEWATDAPILVAASARSELLERRPGWGGGKRDSTILSLAPLSPAETTELIDELSGGTLDAAETARLAERCGGNPLFAEQYVEMRSNGGTAVPETVRAVIQARLDALPPPEKHLLQDAAVLGQVFWSGAVAADEERLRALGRRQLLRRARGSSVAGEPQYSFVHALVRDVAYAQIPRAERIDKHVRAATWIEALGRPDDYAELLGHHYQQALTLARASGDDLGAVVPRARAALALAGDRARALYAFDTAERYYADALALWPADAARERADLVYRNAVVAFERGEDGRGEVLDRAAEALRAAGDDTRAADVEQMRGDVSWAAGEHDRYRAHLDRALRLVAPGPPGIEKASVLAQTVRLDMLSTTRFGADQERAAREALALVEALELDELRAHLLISIGTHRAAVGEDAGLDQLAQGVAAARAGNWLYAVYRGVANLGALQSSAGRMREALEHHGEAMELAEQAGNRAQWRLARGKLIQCYVESGDWVSAAAAADELLADSERLDAIHQDVIVACVRAVIRLGRGELDGAIADQAFALQRARMVKNPQILFYALAVAVHVLADTGRLAEARERFDELARSDEAAFRYVDFALGDVAWAATVIDRAEPARRALAVAEWPSFRAARAIVAGHFAGAAAIYDAHGAARSAALARLRGGLDDGARAFFARIGAARYAEM